MFMSSGKGLTMLGDDAKGLKIHDLVKALPTRLGQRSANNPGMLPIQQRLFTPEMTTDGQPCSAVTVILRTKGCHWWWSSGCTFCGYFNDTRDDVNSDDLHAQWQHAKEKFNNFEGQAMVKVYTSGSLLEDREIPVDFKKPFTAVSNLVRNLLLKAELNNSQKKSWLGQLRLIQTSPLQLGLKHTMMKCYDSM